MSILTVTTENVYELVEGATTQFADTDPDAVDSYEMRDRNYSEGRTCADCGVAIINNARWCRACFARHRKSGMADSRTRAQQQVRRLVRLYRRLSSDKCGQAHRRRILGTRVWGAGSGVG